ncbi:hypothetical protein [Streptomyces sp. NPDC059564]|uniref:hypothetical protein n=1 Tax=Streptomyces sp. NPDC059564 TaxID=3346865 RepID=UPI00368DEE63
MSRPVSKLAGVRIGVLVTACAAAQAFCPPASAADSSASAIAPLAPGQIMGTMGWE